MRLQSFLSAILVSAVALAHARPTVPTPADIMAQEPTSKAVQGVAEDVVEQAIRMPSWKRVAEPQPVAGALGQMLGWGWDPQPQPVVNNSDWKRSPQPQEKL